MLGSSEQQSNPLAQQTILRPSSQVGGNDQRPLNTRPHTGNEAAPGASGDVAVPKPAAAAAAAAARLVDAVSSEVVRKLRLASETETKEDREIVCEEVFCDVTGLVDEAAQVRELGLALRLFWVNASVLAWQLLVIFSCS